MTTHPKMAALLEAIGRHQIDICRPDAELAPPQYLLDAIRDVDALLAPAVQDAPPLTIDKMLLRDGLYGVSDTNRPEALVPIVVIGGTAYALHREPIPLCHWGWLETAVVCGGPILPLAGDGRASMSLPKDTQ